MQEEIQIQPKKKGKRSSKKAEAKPRKRGRPTIYTPELGDKICARLAKGESLLKICEDSKMPERTTVHQWLLREDMEEFINKYARARDTQADYLFDEILELSDESVDDVVGDDKSDSARINARKLQVDSRKWYLSKVLPKKYGDKLDLTSGGEPIKTNQITFVGYNEPESQ